MAWTLFSTSERERVNSQGGRRDNQLSPVPWPLSEPGPRMEGDCWCQGWEVVSAESRNVRPPLPKKKSIKSPRGPGPSLPSPAYEKVQNIITKGGLRGPLSQGSQGPCPSPALPRTPRPARLGPGLRAFMGGPRPAQAQAGPCHAGARWAPPPHTPALYSGLPLPTACPCLRL